MLRLTLRFLILCVPALVLISLPGCRRTTARVAPAPAPPVVVEPPTVTLAAVGDVLLARYVGTKIERNGPDYPFEKTKDVISSADIAFFNLECPLSTRGVARRRKFLFRAHPKLAHNLKNNGFDVACLANNHTLDYGRTAMMDTIDSVEKAGLVAIGAGKNREEAIKLKIIEKNGLNVGFLAYTDVPSAGVVRLTDKPTVAGANIDDLPDEIRSAKSECDVLVVSFHWGVEYMKRPNERQQEIARLCIDNGADLILGHHPHVLQTVETYKDKPIIYSMGGFIWDPKLKDTDKSAIYLFELSKSSARLTRTLPIRIVQCQPRTVSIEQ